MKNHLFLSVFICSILIIYVPANAGIYSWVDENGVRHFSNTAPSEAVSEVSENEEVEFDSEKDYKRTLEDEKKSSRKGRTSPQTAHERKLSPQEKKKIDQEIRSTWNGMKKALKKGDINKALQYHHPSSRERYREIYQELRKTRN